jgi:hypothetical protein
MYIQTAGGCTARVVSTRGYPHAVALEPSWRPAAVVEALEEHAARLAVSDAVLYCTYTVLVLFGYVLCSLAVSS